MKIENMEQVKQNLGKRVLFQSKLNEKQVTGRIVYGKTEDCEGDAVGYEEEYSVLYDNPSYVGATWYYIEEEDFFQDDILLFETIED